MAKKPLRREGARVEAIFCAICTALQRGLYNLLKTQLQRVYVGIKQISTLKLPKVIAIQSTLQE